MTRDLTYTVLLAMVAVAASIPVWTAGSPDYGLLSRIWRYVPSGALLAAALVAIVLSTLHFVRSASANYRVVWRLVAAPLLVAAWANLLLLGSLYILQKVIQVG